MSFVRKEDAAKAGKLIGAIVVVFGCAAWRVVGATTPPASPKPSATEATSGATETIPASGASDGTTDGTAKREDDGTIEIPRNFVPTRVDPFRTVAVAKAPEPESSAPTESLPTLPAPTGNGGVTGPLAGGSVVGNPLAGTPAQPLLPVAPAPGATPLRLRVTGIVSGTNATAVLEMGENVRVVRVGNVLADGTRVVRIDATEVLLKRGGKPIVLDVGE